MSRRALDVHVDLRRGAGDQPFQDQLYRALLSALRSGRLPAGSRLPSSRRSPSTWASRAAPSSRCTHGSSARGGRARPRAPARCSCRTSPTTRPIITEAADYVTAQRLGVNYAPKLANGAGTGGDQQVSIEDGRMQFRGAVDFSPERVLVAGEGDTPFPPSVAQPGAVADSEWSSLVVLPSGSVLNAQVVANDTGLHDRAISVDEAAQTVTLQLLDGWQGGDRYYYHLVTDSSDPVAATIELGVYAPRLANLPAFGRSLPEDDSALLGFSPTANGTTGAGDPDRQGLNSTIVDDDRDPVNVFPLDPDNDRRFDNNYSPMWDAHVSMWTDEAVASGQRRVITGFDDLEQLVDDGLLTSFAGSPGEANAFVAGLRATGIIINCPVIAQPFEGQDRAPEGPRF